MGMIFRYECGRFGPAAGQENGCGCMSNRAVRPGQGALGKGEAAFASVWATLKHGQARHVPRAQFVGGGEGEGGQRECRTDSVHQVTRPLTQI